MQIEERTVGNVTILDLKGKLVLGDGDALGPQDPDRRH